MRVPTFVSLPTLALAGGMLLTGCGPKDPVAWHNLKNNLTPELAGVSESKLDQERDLAVVNNLSWRAFSDDWGRFWLLDQPTQLTPYPVINTGGNPQ
jgi:hypothetical protein